MRSLEITGSKVRTVAHWCHQGLRHTHPSTLPFLMCHQWLPPWPWDEGWGSTHHFMRQPAWLVLFRMLLTRLLVVLGWQIGWSDGSEMAAFLSGRVSGMLGLLIEVPARGLLSKVASGSRPSHMTARGSRGFQRQEVGAASCWRRRPRSWQAVTKLPAFKQRGYRPHLFTGAVSEFMGTSDPPIGYKPLSWRNKKCSHLNQKFISLTHNTAAEMGGTRWEVSFC